MISIQNFKYIYLILLVGGGTFQVCLKMLLEHFNHNAAIYNILNKKNLYTDQMVAG